jgi:hypothetical protein
MAVKLVGSTTVGGSAGAGVVESGAVGVTPVPPVGGRTIFSPGITVAELAGAPLGLAGVAGFAVPVAVKSAGSAASTMPPFSLFFNFAIIAFSSLSSTV